MRGKVRMKLFPWEKFGITPAHAGKRQLLPPLIRLRRDHPRTCGEKPDCLVHDCVPAGSPPHMRGKGAASASARAVAGITPAHAGKRPEGGGGGGPDLDHPRTCGEKLAPSRVIFTFSGSPPHMRGKDYPRRPASDGRGITPAHAGKRLRKP